MQEATSNQCLQTSKELTPLYPASVATPATSFNAQAEFDPTSAAAAPFTPITDASCFNPAGMPYFSQFPAYPVNFQYFPSTTVSQWRPSEASFATSLSAPYPSNVPLPFTSSSAVPSGRRRKARKLYTPAQIDILMREFRVNGYVSKEERVRIGRMTGIPEDKVKIWYQNRRYKEKHTEGSESTSSEGRRTRSPRQEEERSSSSIFPSPHRPEASWLPDLNTPPSAPPFMPSGYTPQSFTFFPPPAYPPFMPPAQGFQESARTQLTQFNTVVQNLKQDSSE